MNRSETQRNYIRVGETRRSIDEKRKQKEIQAKLYVRGMIVCEVIANTSADDQDPHGSAIALLWLTFQQKVGQKVRVIDAV